MLYVDTTHIVINVTIACCLLFIAFLGGCYCCAAVVAVRDPQLFVPSSACVRLLTCSSVPLSALGDKLYIYV